MSDQPYQPIACVDHERLEFAALTKQWLELGVHTQGQVICQRLLPRDVLTREQAEWLVAETESGEMVTLRLDCLQF